MSTLAAILRASRDGGAWEGPVDEALVRAAWEHGVAPLVYRALRQVGVWPQQESPAHLALARIAYESVLRDERGRRDLRRVLDELATAGLAPLVFKGTALACRHYPEPWLRPRVDTDLLIREGERDRAAEVLERCGFVRLPRPTGDHVTHQFIYVNAGYGMQAMYDVHWRVADPQVFADMWSYDELAAEAIPLPLLGPHARTMADHHALLVACTHRVAHHYDTESLLLLYDIDLLARALDAVSWDRVIDLASAKRIRSVCARGLTLAAEQFATPVPPRVLRALTSPDEFEPSAAYLGPHLRRVDILRSDLRALDGWRERVRLLREHLLPPPTYMRQSYQRHPLLLPALYVHRIVRGALSWFQPLRQ